MTTKPQTLTVNTCEMSHATVSGLTYTNFHWRGHSRGLEVTGLPDSKHAGNHNSIQSSQKGNIPMNIFCWCVGDVFAFATLYHANETLRCACDRLLDAVSLVCVFKCT